MVTDVIVKDKDLPMVAVEHAVQIHRTKAGLFSLSSGNPVK
jgi:hypothetical protein